MTKEDQANGLRPVPRIDHVMVLLDGTAYEDIIASGFLAERFCRLKGKQADSSVAGRYATLGLAGDNTLLELFNAEVSSFAPLTGGLVFSFEEPGSAPVARAMLDALGPGRHHGDLVKREVEGHSEQQPWYQLISVDLGPASPLLLFLNEVTTEYFTSVGARSADGSLRRRDYLDAVLGTPADDSLLMRDITGVTLLVRPERAGMIADALSVFGYEAIQQVDGIRLRGDQLTIDLRTDESAPERITQVEMRISGDLGEDTKFQFGKTCQLLLESGSTARWIFDR